MLHAEFWAEDGWAWFPGGYNDGVASLLEPAASYLQTLSRLAGLLVQALPMAWAPTAFAVAALGVQALPPVFLVSDRMQEAWPSPAARFVFALIWLTLPNSAEEYVNLTNTQWHLAALAFLVLFSRPPAGRGAQAGDIAILALSGLSGPTCLMLLPLVAWRAACSRASTQWQTSLHRAVLVAATSAIQGAILLWNHTDRATPPLGAGPTVLARIVSQQVILGPLIGQGGMSWLHASPLWQSDIVPFAILLFGVTLTLVACWRGPGLLRMACLFSSMILGAALLQPVVSHHADQWPELLMPGAGQRYYYLPMLAWIGVIMTLLSYRWPPVRIVGGLLAAGLLCGIWSDWRMPDRRQTHYAAQVKVFLRIPKGAAMAFPINPFMDQVPMILFRK